MIKIMKFTSMKYYTLLLLATLSTLNSYAQLTDPENWQFFQSTQKVNTVLEDGDELWYGTEHGLVIVNKTSLEQTYYNRYNSDIPSDDVKAIEKIGDTKWIGTYDLVLLQIQGDDWTTIQIPIDESQLLVNEMPRLYCMKADQEGNLWIGTNYGVVKYDGEVFEIINYNNTPELGNTFQDVWAIETDEANNLYFSSFELYRYSEGAFTNLSDGDFNLFAYGDPRLCYGGGKLWYSTFSLHIAWYDVSEGWHFLPQDSLPNSLLNGISTDQQGNPYFYYQYGGIYQYEDGSMTATATDITDEGGLDVQSLLFDHDNNPWVSNKAGFYTQSNGEIRSGILGDTPMKNNNISFLTEDKNGTIFMINDYNNILSYDYVQGWSTVELPEVSVNISVYGIVFDSQNDMWISTTYGLFHFDGAEWEIFNNQTDPAVPFASCYKMEIDQNDRKWMVVPGSKLIKFDGDTWTVYAAGDIPWETYLIDIEVDHNDNVWVSDSEGQLFRINQEGSYDQIDINSIILTEYTRVQSIYFDKNNTPWIVTNYNDGHQVYKREGETWVELEDDSDEIYYNGFITEDETGLYFGSYKDIIHLANDGSIDLISKENSLLPDQTTGTLFMDSQNSLWALSYDFGLSLYNATGFTLTDLKDISEEACAVKWQAYPIPATQVVTIEAVHTSFFVGQSIPLTLMDVQGKVILAEKVQVTGQNSILVNLDVSSFSNGIYYIQAGNLPAKPIVIGR